MKNCLFTFLKLVVVFNLAVLFLNYDTNQVVAHISEEHDQIIELPSEESDDLEQPQEEDEVPEESNSQSEDTNAEIELSQEADDEAELSQESDDQANDNAEQKSKDSTDDSHSTVLILSILAGISLVGILAHLLIKKCKNCKKSDK